MQNTKKILIFYNAVGLGHKKIAENIGWVLEQQGHKVFLENILEVEKNNLGVWGEKIHKFINLYLPFVWSFLYTNPIFINMSLPFRLMIASKNSKKTLVKIRNCNPDIIISTHTIASAVISYLKKQKLVQANFGIAFSDYHLHKYWLYEEADFYLANTEEQKNEMQSFGINPTKIFVVGMVLKSAQEHNLAALKTKYKIKVEQKVILVSSGSLGWGNSQDFLLKLSHKFKECKIIVICGKNEQAYRNYVNIFKNTNILALGFVEDMSELYAISDIFLSKPGGLSVAEALQFNLPIVITHKLPGQEQKNLVFLLEKQLVIAPNEDIFSVVEAELVGMNFKKQLKNNKNLQQILDRKNEILKAI